MSDDNDESSQAPGMSAQEKNLLKQQSEILAEQLQSIRSQREQFDMLAPFLFEDLGLKPIVQGGKIVGFEELPDELKPLREKSEKLLLERSVAALEGRLPVSPQLQQELSRSKGTLEETLRRSLGPDFAATTAGADAMAQFTREEENVLEAARRGDISLGEQLSIGRQAGNQAAGTQDLASVLGIHGAGSGIPAMFGAAAAGLSGPIQAFMNSRNMQTQFQMNENNQPSPWMAGAAGFGQLAGTLLTSSQSGGGSLFGNLFA